MPSVLAQVPAPAREPAITPATVVFTVAALGAPSSCEVLGLLKFAISMALQAIALAQAATNNRVRAWR